MAASSARRQETVRELVRRYMTQTNHPEGPVTLSVPALAERFNQPAVDVRAALESLKMETGRGVHHLGGDHYEYRPVERIRKRTDTQVRVKVARYMQQETLPGSRHKVENIARACGTLPGSTSTALKALSEDPYLYIIKVGYGEYSYRPPGTPNASEEPVQEPTAPSPADMPSYREPLMPFETVPAEEPDSHRFVVVDLTEDEKPTPRLDALMATDPPWFTGEIPAGWLKVVHTSSKGTVLAEDHNGNLNKVIPIEENQ